MKYFILILFLLISSVFADDIQWAKDFHTGVKEATLKNKPVLFVFSRHSCYYCRVLDETTFKDKKVIEVLNKNFISIISYTDENDYTPNELKALATPTIWFLDVKDKLVLKKVSGAVGAESFLKTLAIVKKEFDKMTGK